MGNAAALRIIDANFNRAGEGLRVVEEYVRFALDDKALSSRLKDMRHNLRKSKELIAGSLADNVKAENFRDTPGDVGTQVTNSSEAERANAESVAAASLKRMQEALRALEEYGKIFSTEAAKMLEATRYESYSVEPLILACHTRKEKLKNARLYVLVTESLASTDAITTCREAVAGGADIIQMREKDIEDGEFYEKAVKMREICHAGGALFLINDRPHIAALADADGIHTGQGDLPVHLARRIVGYDRIIGKSTSAPEFAEKAAKDGADYIGVGPVYPTNTKEHRAAVGLEYVSFAAQNAKVPYFCIGSINRDTLDGVLQAGAHAVAVCTAIIGKEDIAAQTAWFKERIKENSREEK